MPISLTPSQERAYYSCMQETRLIAPQHPLTGRRAELTLLDRIRDIVVSGVVEPGEMLGESSLAEEFGVSRTPVREALKQLEREGLVEIRARVGTFVRKPSQREVVELFQLKESLEGLAAGLLARRGDVPALQDLDVNVIQEREAVVAQDRGAYAALVHDFHHTLVAGADNAKLSEHYDMLMNQLAYHRIVAQSLTLPGRLEASLSEHGRILDAIRTKDPLTAEFAMRRHVSHSQQAAALATESDPSAPEADR